MKMIKEVPRHRKHMRQEQIHSFERYISASRTKSIATPNFLAKLKFIDISAACQIFQRAAYLRETKWPLAKLSTFKTFLPL